MKQKVNIETWARRDHFNFFNQIEEPFYGVCVRVDCTKAYRFTKANNLSFHLYCLYCAMGAVYAVEPFKYRVNNGEVFIYDNLIAGTTVSRSNDTFGFAYFDYNPVLELFLEGANKAIEQVKARTDLIRSPAENVIRFSSLPWIDFTSLTHARKFSVEDSCPKIAFGKMTESNGVRSMPLSVYVHHALVDGLHVGQYIDCLQELMDSK